MRFLPIVAFLIQGAVVSSALRAETVYGPGDRFATGWLLVRLVEPIPVRSADGTFPLVTGRASLDRLIAEARVHRIDSAFPIATADPAFGDAHRRYGLDRTYRFQVPSGTDIISWAAHFASLREVEYAEPDWIGTGGAVVPNDPFFPNQWGLQQASDADVDAPEGWATSVGSGVIIAVLDTGIDGVHEDLADKAVPGYDFVNNDDDPTDDHGHGTNVASIASANSNNGRGVAGSCWNCRLMPLKVLDSSNSGLYSWWADAMVWATDRGARVINLSAGGFSSSQTLYNGVRYAWDAGVVHVSITHNDNLNAIRYPGNYSEPITVGGTDSLDRRAVPFCYSPTSGSNYGDEIDVVAPGELILGAAFGGGYNAWCGTSQAAPLVAGVVGIMKTVYPSIGREEARHLLEAGAEDQVGRVTEDTAGFDIYHGWGRVNMDRTLRSTQASITLRAEGEDGTRLFFSTPNPLASSYDFIRGDLGALSESAAGVDLGDVVCLESDSPDPDTLGDEDADVPPSGQGYVYFARINAAPGPGSYGGSSRNRDRQPASGDCGPACGNDVCEAFAGEDCVSCPADCNGVQSGNPGNRYCCGDGDGENPVPCSDPRCTAGGKTCVP